VFLLVCHAISDISGTAFLLVHEHVLILVLQDDHQQYMGRITSIESEKLWLQEYALFFWHY
jgi:hypothetical protein